MLTAADPDDLQHPRVARHMQRFAAAEAPAPPDWRQWPALLADCGGPRAAALNVPPAQGFGTVCSALIGIGGTAAAQSRRVPGRQFLFAAGPPGHTAFEPVAWPEGEIRA
jgi:hypothetical protein